MIDMPVSVAGVMEEPLLRPYVPYKDSELSVVAGELKEATEKAAKLFSIVPVSLRTAPLTSKLFVLPVHFLSGLPWSLASHKNALTLPESPAGLELTPTWFQSQLSFPRR